MTVVINWSHAASSEVSSIGAGLKLSPSMSIKLANLPSAVSTVFLCVNDL